MRFSQMVKMFEKQDHEIIKLNNDLRAIVMPQMSVPVPTQTETES